MHAKLDQLGREVRERFPGPRKCVALLCVDEAFALALKLCAVCHLPVLHSNEVVAAAASRQNAHRVLIGAAVDFRSDNEANAGSRVRWHARIGEPEPRVCGAG